MNHKQRAKSVEVTSDAEGLISHSGAFLLAELADRIGFTDAASRELFGLRERRSAHDPGAVARDLCVAIADGADCVSDLGVLRDQEDLFGKVASISTARRAIASIGDGGLEAIRKARAKARERAWDQGARPDELILDIDATLLTAHSEKEDAAGTYKNGFGFHPLLCYLDETGEALSGLLRPGNAGANTARDHTEVLELALEQIPAGDLDREILIRADTAGATHELTGACRQAGIRFSVGYEITQPVREAILEASESAWQPAIDEDSSPRENGWVTELTDRVDLSAWPEGTRLICRRERPHPGAQFEVFDSHGYRYTAFLTDQQGEDIAALEIRHRQRARVEDRIRAGKDTGMRNLPFHSFEDNAAWLELSLVSQDLLAHARSLCLSGELSLAEPKRLRQRLFHVAGRIATSGRQRKLRLARDWPWSRALEAAFEQLRALPPPQTA